jgi:hypothetical protein
VKVGKTLSKFANCSNSRITSMDIFEISKFPRGFQKKLGYARKSFCTLPFMSPNPKSSK